MTYTLTFSSKRNYLHILFGGDFVAGDVSGMWNEIHGYLHKNYHERVLVEERPEATVTEMLDTLEIYDAAKSFSLSQPEKNLKVALLYNEGVSAETLEQALFGETVALNRGFTLRVFNNEALAKEWLLLNEPNNSK